MARQTVVHVTDDLDGSAGAEEVTFGYQGVEYAIDLGKKNRQAFEKLLKNYIDAARKAPRGRGRRTRAGTSGSKVDLAVVRVWAREQGYEVSDRGRVPQDILSKYDEAH